MSKEEFYNQMLASEQNYKDQLTMQIMFFFEKRGNKIFSEENVEEFQRQVYTAGNALLQGLRRLNGKQEA
jgi:hypothetical protein